MTLRIAFDFGGTLVPIIRHDMDDIIKDVMIEHCGAKDGAPLYESFLELEDEYWDTSPWRGPDTPDHLALLTRAATRAGVSVGAESEGDLMADLHQTFLQRVEPREGMANVLHSLAGSVGTFGLLSNWLFPSSWLKDWLEAHGVLHLFACVGASSDLGVRKPEASAFRWLLGEMEIEHSADLLFVGDSYAEDVLGAVSVGSRACWLVRDGAASRAHPLLAGTIQIETLGELSSVFPSCGNPG